MYRQKSELRKSGVLISLLILVLFFLLPFLLHSSFNSLALVLCLIIFLTSIFQPYSLRKPIEYWLKIGDILSKINSNIILGIFFYFILVPAAIFRRIIKKFKVFKIKKELTSYYHRKNLSESNLSDQY